MAADVVRGVYIDPAAGKVTLRSYADDWLRAQTVDPLTREATTSRLRTHVYPVLGDRELRALRPSTVQAWLSGLTGAASSIRVIYANLSSVLSAAVDDGLIVKNPCRAASVRPPALDRRRVVPWTTERLDAVRAALPAPCRAMVDAGAGCGMRQGEVFGLAVDDVDWLRGWIHVVRQVKILGGKTLVFAPPKRGKERDTPLSEEVSLRFSAHIADSPPVAVTLPWRVPDGPPVTAQLMFTSPTGQAHNRSRFNERAWRPALRATAVPINRENGMHALRACWQTHRRSGSGASAPGWQGGGRRRTGFVRRLTTTPPGGMRGVASRRGVCQQALRHWFASVQLEGGTSIKALAEYLGHHDPGFTLRTYTHLMPSSEGRARKAVDRALRGETTPDGTLTEHADDV